MSELYTAIPTGITAFAVTNLDDIVILSLLFSQVNALFRRHHIVAGQYLGFASLIVLSLPSFFGSMLFPPAWIGLLGIFPIVIGINRWLNQDAVSDQVNAEEHSINSWFTSFLSPQSYSVAALTIANGGDNVAIYAPLFATSTLSSLVVILAVFFSLVGVWCYAAYQLTRTRAIANVLTTYGNQLVPFVLIGLGIVILMKSHTLENPSLAVLSLVLSCFCLLAQNRHIWQTAK